MDQEAIMDAGKKRKLDFFKELDKLDVISDTEEHNNDNAGVREKPTSIPRLNPANNILVPRSPDCVFVEARTAPKPKTDIGSNATSVVKGTPHLTKNPNRDVKDKMENSPSNHPEASTVPRKKKKKGPSSPRQLLESQQIFKGLVFFFVPNNDVSPARRMRINKARELGAVWAKTWHDQISHVIVDRELCYEDVMRYLKLRSFPPSMALVNDTYTADCIKFRSTVDVSYSRFRVRGAQSPDTREPASSAQPSLALKPYGKRSPVATPPRAEEDLESFLGRPEPNTVVGNGGVGNGAVGNRAKGNEVMARRVMGNQGMGNDTVAKGVMGNEATGNRVMGNSEAIPNSNTVHDVLEELIEEVKGEEVLPLDSEEDELSTTTSSNDERPKKKSMGRITANPRWQQSFTCMQKHDGKEDNPNARTIGILEQMLEHYERTSDQWRTIAYRKAISALRREKEKIVSKDQALRIPCIGERLASKIEEIVWTNRLRRLEYANLEPNDKILQMFLNIYGVGFAQASKWIAQGHRSLDDLKKVDLTKNQQIGVEHYDDFLQRIPRAEVEAHGDVVRQAILKVDPGVQAMIAGSYRRGASNSGDIDMLITKPGASLDEIRSLMMDVVVPELFQKGFLQASLAISNRSDGSKWHGASVLPESKVWRRIDLLFVPWDEIGAALIYFTGNDIFNRSLRLLASKKGMCLNQRGLFEDVLRGANRIKMNAGRLLEGQNEKRIFELLGVPWRPPEHRIC